MPFLVVAGLLCGAILFTRVSRLVLHRLVRRMAERSRADTPTRWWRAGSIRVGGESAAATEQRRRQRVDAASRMLNHVVALVVWIGVSIAVFHMLDVDAAFFLSSAGFIGAGVAIGGQHKVNDYLTGLSVLFEDRYGIGDELVVDVGRNEPLHGIVDHVGLVTTRLRDETSTLHVPNAALTLVRNLSQESSAATLRLRVADDIAGLETVSERSAAETLRQLAGTQHLTDVVFVGDLAAARAGEGEIDVAVRTLRPLDERARSVLVERAEHALRVGD